ncbi:MAG: hypothetical protein K8S24_02770 [Candidatus Aegiribacteria sp.]|nr:hypothetical protein [Candidatus Aegiribacteria sp.]
MNCPDFNTLMMLLDSELTGEKLKEVSEHVKSCSRCRDLIGSQRKLEASWRDSFVTPKDDKFRSMEWIIYRRMNRPSRWKFFVPAAAGIIAVLLGVKLIMNNEPFKGRDTEFLREGRIDYVSYTLRFENMRDESTLSDIDVPDYETVLEGTTVTVPPDSDISTGWVSTETACEAEDISIADGVLEMPQSAVDGEGAGEHLRGAGDFAQESDQENIVGGAVTGSTSGGSGGAGFPGYVEECGESELAFGTVSGDDAVEDICHGDMIDETCEITCTLDTDTTGLATAQTVDLSVSPCEESQDNRAFHQYYEYHSRFNETSDNDMGVCKGDIYVELVFDADGQPDSSTVLLLDSLFSGWSDYISFIYRDTVLVIPLADIQQLIVESSTVPAQTIE